MAVTREEIRAMSVAMFGNADRLFAAAAIGRLEGKPISAKAVAAESGLDPNRAQEQVAHFRKHGLLVLDNDPALKRKDHRPVSLTYWAAAARLLEQLLEKDELD
jgi:hypothetical protein